MTSFCEVIYLYATLKPDGKREANKDLADCKMDRDNLYCCRPDIIFYTG